MNLKCVECGNKAEIIYDGKSLCINHSPESLHSKFDKTKDCLIDELRLEQKEEELNISYYGIVVEIAVLAFAVATTYLLAKSNEEIALIILFLAFIVIIILYTKWNKGKKIILETEKTIQILNKEKDNKDKNL